MIMWGVLLNQSTKKVEYTKKVKALWNRNVPAGTINPAEDGAPVLVRGGFEDLFPCCCSGHKANIGINLLNW
jgi:hypothetical protein